MFRAWAVAERDLRKFFRTPALFLPGVIFPIVHLVIMGYSFEGELKRLPVVVVNQDSGPYAVKVQQNLSAVAAGNKTIDIAAEQDEAYARKLTQDGRYYAALIIPPDFSRKMTRGEPAELGLILDNTDAFAARAIEAVVQSALLGMERRPEVKETALPGVRVERVQLYRKIEYIAYLVPGVIVMATFMGTMISGATNLVMDRFQGVHESYFLTPLTKTDIVLGMLTSGMITTSFTTIVATVISCVITGVYPPNLRCAILAAGLISLTAVGLLGLMFLAYSPVRNPRVIGIVGGFLNMILYFPSGAVYPVESFPAWLQAFSVIDPETYAVHAMKALLLRGSSTEAVVGDVAVVGLFAVCSAAAAIAAFRRRL